MFDRKTKWRFQELGEDERGDWQRNYPSLAEHAELVLKQFLAEESEGLMSRTTLREALKIYGADLMIAATGAIEKKGRTDEVRVIFDGSRGCLLNPGIRVRDQVRYPTASDGRALQAMTTSKVNLQVAQANMEAAREVMVTMQTLASQLEKQRRTLEAKTKANREEAARLHAERTAQEETLRNTEKILDGKFPARVVEKAVERMIPRGPLGRNAMRNLHVYAGPTHPHEAQQPKTLDIASMNDKNKR